MHLSQALKKLNVLKSAFLGRVFKIDCSIWLFSNTEAIRWFRKTIQDEEWAKIAHFFPTDMVKGRPHKMSFGL